MSDIKPYSEDNPQHVPNPLYQTGFVDTSGVSGQTNIDDVSPVFAEARAQALANAVEAIDNPDIDESRTVVFPDTNGTDDGRAREDAIEELRQAAADAADAVQGDVEPTIRKEGEQGPGGDVQSGGVGAGAEQNDSTKTGGEPQGGSNSDPDDADGDNLRGFGETGGYEQSQGGSNSETGDSTVNTEGFQGSGEGDESLPADTDSKAKWIQFAEANNLDVDKTLNKEPYVEAVKQAYRSK